MFRTLDLVDNTFKAFLSDIFLMSDPPHRAPLGINTPNFFDADISDFSTSLSANADGDPICQIDFDCFQLKIYLLSDKMLKINSRQP